MLLQRGPTWSRWGATSGDAVMKRACLPKTARGNGSLPHFLKTLCGPTLQALNLADGRYRHHLG